ncbi:MAG: hypothetical protein ACYS6K_08230 [Planctomycetota bacterium]
MRSSKPILPVENDRDYNYGQAYTQKADAYKPTGRYMLSIIESKTATPIITSSH